MSLLSLHRTRGLALLQRRFMSVRPAESSTSKVPARKKVTIQTLQSLKASKTPIAMLTAYDYPTALACSLNPSIDITFVGDSLAQTCLGYPSTTQATLSDMIHHSRAVARANTHPLLLVDMPFGSYHVSISDTLKNAVDLVQRGHAEAVKMEGGEEIADLVRSLTAAGIPVMAHVGLTPQRHVSLSGYKVQGKDANSAKRILQDALALEAAGAFGIVLEAIPKELGKYITEKLTIPTIGIGAGPWTDGQVLVWDDVVGTWPGHKAKFVRRFADIKKERDNAVQNYAEGVKTRSFPCENSESYSIDQGEWERFLALQ